MPKELSPLQGLFRFKEKPLPSRQSAPEALAELPAHCDVRVKKNSKGYKQAWIGYKLHVDVSDCGLPISAVLTATSLHESQVAAPLMEMTSGRIDYLYDLMDSAYDAQRIYEMSRSRKWVFNSPKAVSTSQRS